MEIREVDPADEALTRRFWEVGKVADEQGRPWSPYWSWPAARASFTSPTSPLEKLLLCAFDGEEMLGGAEISLPRHDHHHLGWLEVSVDPQHQRRVAGTALVEAAVDAVARQGRSLVMVDVATPLDGPESPGLRLARRLGFETGVVNDMSTSRRSGGTSSGCGRRRAGSGAPGGRSSSPWPSRRAGRWSA